MRYPYRSLGVAFNREYRNDLNLNFTDIAADMAELAARTNIALEAADEAETQALFAQTQGNYAQDQGDFAYTQGAFAQAQGNIAQSNEATRQSNESSRQSNEATRQANEAARNTAEADRYSAEVLRESAEDTRESNETTRQANETVRQSQEAARQAAIVDIEQTANDADQKATAALQYTVGKYLAPVDTFADIATTYPTPDANDRVFVRDTGKTFIYQDGTWQEFAELNETPINELDNRLTQQLADIAIDVRMPHHGLTPAKGDGVTDDTLAIYQIMLYATQNNFRVFLPIGTYLLGTFQSVETNTFLPLMSNLYFFGAGENSVLKIRDGLGGDGHVFYKPENTSVSIKNITFKDFVIDFNGENNLVPETNPYRLHMGIGLTHGEKIEVRNVIFKNNAGQQCVSLGSNTSPHTISDVKITDCKFEKVGKGVSGNIYQIDHSCIYIQADKASVTNNQFSNNWFTDTGTAIEDHSSNIIISGNQINNMATGLNIVALVTDKKYSLYQNNQIKNVRLAYHFWTGVGFTMDEVMIEGDQIVQIDSTSSVFDISSDVQSPIGLLTIKNNNVTCEDTATSTIGSGILIGHIKKLIVKNNTFTGIRGRSVSLDIYNDDENEIYIDNNEFFDCGATTSPQSVTYKDTMVFFGYGKLKKLSITNNKIINSDGTYARVGVNGNAPVSQFEFVGNNFDLCSVNDIEWDDTVVINSFYLDHVSTFTPSVRADVNSVWVDKTNKHKYVKRFDVYKIGWRKEFYSLTIPTAGAHLNGDRAINLDPQPGSFLGWVCVGGGSPGIWKGYGLIEV